jgi:hypothetical protein
MLRVAGYEHYGVEVPVRKHSAASDLAAIVNGFAVGDRKVGSRGNKVVQVNHGTAGLPDESMDLEDAGAVSRRAGDLAFCIHEVSNAACIVVDGSQICHHSFFPKESVKFLVATGRRAPRNFSGIV